MSINSLIATNLKEKRRSLQLTLHDLAKATGVSKTMLGEIERGSANPSIAVLWKIADGLKIPLTSLLEKEDNKFTVVKAGKGKVVSKNSDYCIESIFPFQNSTEFFELSVSKGCKIENSGHRKGSVEYLFVNKGEIVLTLDGKDIVLTKGDSIKFKGDMTHVLTNTHTSIAKILNIIEYGLNV